MLWLKRNLFLAVGGVVALGCLGFALFYVFQSVSRNTAVEAELETKKSALDKLYAADPFPSTTNIATARREVQRLTNAVVEAEKHFQPFTYADVTGLEFKNQLDNTVFRLTQKAERASIQLPDNPYYFSFAAQKLKLNPDPASYGPINQQLAEVEAICNIIFDARVHSLTSLKRVRVTTDDPPDSRDYRTDWSFETNEITGAVISPYEVTFTCFSSDLANVMERFEASPHGFIIRAVSIDDAPPPPPQGGQPAAGQGIPGRPPVGGPARRSGVVTPPPTAPGENVTVLNEERFQTTLWIAVVKPKR